MGCTGCQHFDQMGRYRQSNSRRCPVHRKTGASTSAADMRFGRPDRGRRFVHVSTTAERFPMFIRLIRAGLPGLAIALVPMGEGVAHEIVGNRFFPATLGIDDPGVNDELSFPTVSSFKTGDDPSFKQRDISGEFSKRITEAFAVSFGVTHSHFSAPGGPTGFGADGFQNLETTFKYRLFKDPLHEFVMSVGLSVDRSQRRMGQDRCAKRWRGAVQCLHADPVCRQRLRRSSGCIVLDSAGCRYRTVWLCDPGPALDHYFWSRSRYRRSNGGH